MFADSGELEDGLIRGLLEQEVNEVSVVLADSDCKVLMHAELGVVASLGGVCENMGMCSPSAVTSSCTSDPALLLLDLIHAQRHLLLLERYRFIHMRMTAAVTDAAHERKPIKEKKIMHVVFKKLIKIYNN